MSVPKIFSRNTAPFYANPGYRVVNWFRLRDQKAQLRTPLSLDVTSQKTYAAKVCAAAWQMAEEKSLFDLSSPYYNIAEEFNGLLKSVRRVSAPFLMRLLSEGSTRQIAKFLDGNKLSVDEKAVVLSVFYQNVAATILFQMTTDNAAAIFQSPKGSLFRKAQIINVMFMMEGGEWAVKMGEILNSDDLTVEGIARLAIVPEFNLRQVTAQLGVEKAAQLAIEFLNYSFPHLDNVLYFFEGRTRDQMTCAIFRWLAENEPLNAARIFLRLDDQTQFRLLSDAYQPTLVAFRSALCHEPSTAVNILRSRNRLSTSGMFSAGKMLAACWPEVRDLLAHWMLSGKNDLYRTIYHWCSLDQQKEVDDAVVETIARVRSGEAVH
ncbi:MAG: hypothetical protein ABIE84_05080 [bacterium]